MSDRDYIRLGEIADIQVGYAFKSAEFSTDGGTRLLRGDNIAQGTTKWDRTMRWADSASVDQRYILEPDDVVLAMDRPWIEAGLKYAAMKVDDLPAYLVQRVARLRGIAGTDQRFIKYIVGSPEFTNYVLTVQTGTSIPHISGKQISDYAVPVHSPLEQQSIADVLGALDDKINANVKVARTANRLAGHLFDQAASYVTTIPMSQVLTPILGGTPARANSEFWDGNSLWASAKDITGASFSVISTTEEKITQQAVERTKAKPLPAGSVILTARGTVGAVARLAVPSSFNQSCYGFIPDDISPSLLYFSVLRAAEHARALAHGSVFDTITKRTFDYLQIPDFGKLGKSTEAQIAPLLDLVTANVMENATLAKTRDALLPQLMSGNLHVKDAETLVESVV